MTKQEETLQTMSLRNVFRSFRFWPRIFQLLWKAHPGYLILILSLNILQGFLPVLVIMATQELVNGIVISWKGDFSIVLFSFAFLITATLIQETSTILQAYWEKLFETLLSNHVNLLVMKKANDLSLSDFEMPEVQDQLKRAQNESGFRPFQISKQIFGIISGFVTLISASMILLVWKWWVVIPLVMIPLISFVSFLRLGQKEYHIHCQRANQSRQAWYISFLMTRDSPFKEVKLYKLGSYLVGRYRSIIEKFFKQDKLIARKRLGISSLFQVLNLFSGALIIFLILLSAYRREIMIGQVVAFVQAVNLTQAQSQTMIQSILSLCQNNLYIQNLFSFIDIKSRDLHSIDSVPSEKGNYGDVISIRSLEFRDVSFCYPRGKVDSLKQVNIKVNQGETMAIVGHNGSGKSTLIKLLMQLYQHYRGEILINGVSVRELNLEKYQRRIGAVFQDFVQYEMSMRENVGFGNIHYINDDLRLLGAVENAGVRHLMEKLPHKLDSQLGSWFEGGKQLSGGQWQRIAIARSFMRNADVFILDEPSSFLDPQAEGEVFGKFRELVKNKIGIFITHRFSSVAFADKILVMDQGKIMESGSHEDLMNLNGKYAHFYRLQMERYIHQGSNDSEEGVV